MVKIKEMREVNTKNYTIYTYIVEEKNQINGNYVYWYCI